jgi:Calx-beta domain
MSDRSNGQAGAHRCRFPLRAWMLAVLVVTCMGAPGTARADTIVLNSGERIEGAIVDATRNTVFIRRAIGGMRQMRLRDIADVRIDLAEGAEIAGQLLGWVDGVQEVRSGREVVRVRAGRVLTRERQVEASRQPPPQTAPPRALTPRATSVQRVEAPAPAAPEVTHAAEAGRDWGKPGRTGLAEAAPVRDHPAEIAAARTATAQGKPQAPAETVAGPNQAAAAPAASAPAMDRSAEHTVAGTAVAKTATVGPAMAAVAEIRPALVAASKAAAEIRAVALTAVPEEVTAPAIDPADAVSAPKPAEGAIDGASATELASRAAAATEPATRAAVSEVATGGAAVTKVALTPQAQNDGQRLAVRASVGSGTAGEDLVFRIELSRAAEQTVVLIYGTVDGTAVAGEDYEPRQGVVTLARGSKSADVHVPLIKDRRSRADARFELFLTADPKVAEVVDQRISATIPAAD